MLDLTAGVRGRTQGFICILSMVVLLFLGALEEPRLDCCIVVPFVFAADVQLFLAAVGSSLHEVGLIKLVDVVVMLCEVYSFCFVGFCVDIMHA